MEPKELNKLLLTNFPELNNKFDEYTSWQDGLNTGSFIIFEDIFMPFLEMNVETNNKENIERIYTFIELLYDINDEYANNILNIAILENIASYKNSKVFSQHLKENSLKLYEQFDNSLN